MKYFLTDFAGLADFKICIICEIRKNKKLSTIFLNEKFI